MEFSVGDKVVHPRHGFGQITGLERLDLVEGFEHYYVIEVPDQGLTLHVPVRKMEDLGVRPVMSRAKLSRVLETLRGRPCQLSEGYKQRQDRVRERLETGGPLRIAEVVRDLTWHERRAYLTKADSELLARGRDFLAAEIAVVTNTELIEAKQTIDTALVAVEPPEADRQEPEQAANASDQAAGARSRLQTLLEIL
jgi:CarD family transcriptional regulator